MIDEIPVRDPLPKKRSTSFSLGHLATLLGLVFVTLFILLLCSKGFDLIASRIWPQPKPSILSKVEIVADKPPQQQSTIEIPVSTVIPNDAAPPTQAQTPFPEITTTPVAQTTVPEPILPATSEALSAAVTPSVEAQPAVVAVLDTATIENKENVQEKKVATNQTKPVSIAKIKIPGSHPAIEKAIHSNQPNHFTVQIIAMHNPKKLQLFIDKNQFKSNVQIFQSQFQGKPWYVAVYGDFKTREEALKALSDLPIEVKEQKPWIRSMASLQDLRHVGQ